VREVWLSLAQYNSCASAGARRELGDNFGSDKPNRRPMNRKEIIRTGLVASIAIALLPGHPLLMGHHKSQPSHWPPSWTRRRKHLSV
jgi:hypothetical protein